jgi:hypothetical protein
MLPDSPRYLASVGRQKEARELLGRLRQHRNTPQEIDQEFFEIVTLTEERQRSTLQFAKILLGKGGGMHPNLGRRAWLCVWLQIMASWTGTTVSLPYPRQFFLVIQSEYVQYRLSLHILQFS